jgi:RNA polymerase sigma factor (sigma-70 family)
MSTLDSIIEANTGLIMLQLHRLNLRNDPEAESLGYEALYNAAKTYDEEKGYKFSTYATCCIFNALGSYIRTLNKKRQLSYISYNAIAYSDDTGEHEHLEFLASDDVADSVLQDELYETVSKAYLKSYNELTNVKHKAIVHAWHESGYKRTNQEIADLVGVSQPYVNQVISIFKFKVRKRMEEYYHD